jgi:hypothetical protein
VTLLTAMPVAVRRAALALLRIPIPIAVALVSAAA